jgi:hypothetical protein
LYLNFGPAADPPAKEDLGCEYTDKGDSIGVKLEACFHFSRFFRKDQWVRSSAENLVLGVHGAFHKFDLSFRLYLEDLRDRESDWSITITLGEALN